MSPISKTTLFALHTKILQAKGKELLDASVFCNYPPFIPFYITAFSLTIPLSPPAPFPLPRSQTAGELRDVRVYGE